MTKKKKIASRFDPTSTTIPFADVRSFLEAKGFVMYEKGSTSGSRIAFKKPGTSQKISFHKPHNNEVKRSTLKAIQEQLDLIRQRETEGKQNA